MVGICNIQDKRSQFRLLEKMKTLCAQKRT